MKKKNKLCKYHEYKPTRIAYEPKTCATCKYFAYWIPRTTKTIFGIKYKTV